MIFVRAKLLDFDKVIERDYISPKVTSRLLSNIMNYYQFRYPDDNVNVEISFYKGD